MTKKMQKIFNNLEEKLNSKMFMYEMGWITHENCVERITSELQDFDRFILSANVYGAITEAEYLTAIIDIDKEWEKVVERFRQI